MCQTQDNTISSDIISRLDMKIAKSCKSKSSRMLNQVKRETKFGKKVNKELSVKLVSDSQGRGVAQLLHESSKGKVKVDPLILPNATAQQVYNHTRNTENKTCIIIAGTNDSLKKNYDYFIW